MTHTSLVRTKKIPQAPIRARLHILAVLLIALLLALSGSSALAAPGPVGQIQPQAGAWRTWVLSSASQFRSAPPPDRSITAAEIRQLKDMAAQRDPAARNLIAFWDSGGPVYRWNEIAINQGLKANLGNPIAARALALLHVAIYDTTIATWDSKYAYNRPRPSVFDRSLSTALPNPASPSYPSENAAVAAAAAEVLAYLFPKDAAFFAAQAKAASQSRLLAGVEYPSDVSAGRDLGRAVAALVIQRA
jgi:membrane-associated phospholipid phosphatase